MDSLIDTAETAAEATPAEPTEEVAAILAGAVESARQAIIEYSGDAVGAHLGLSVEDAASATHRFLATLPGYHGWQWAVVVAAHPGADHATISEVVLVPGPTALLAPPWIPWEQRVQPGDLGPGDLLAPLPDDPRLAPGFLATGDPLIDDTAVELGFGRRRVLSAFGRDDAAQRWHDSDHGPTAPMARSTKRVCRDCGFMVPLAGALGAMFGVCSNAMSADGRVVDFFYGCGAHSDTPAYEPFDDGVLEIVAVSVVEIGDVVTAEAAAEAAGEALTEAAGEALTEAAGEALTEQAAAEVESVNAELVVAHEEPAPVTEVEPAPGADEEPAPES